MDAALQKIQSLIENAPLAANEKEDLLGLFSKASAVDLDNVVNLFSDDSSLIKTLSDNYQEKKRAIGKNDIELWRKVVNSEGDVLERVSKSES